MRLRIAFIGCGRGRGARTVRVVRNFFGNKLISATPMDSSAA
jgi:hypothetical protein